MSHKSEQVRHTVCSPGACSSSGHWELTGHSRQAGESALRGALAVLPPPTCAGPLRLCLANSKPDAMHTRTKESTDKDNFFFFGGGCLPPCQAPLPHLCPRPSCSSLHPPHLCTGYSLTWMPFSRLRAPSSDLSSSGGLPRHPQALP